MSDSGMDKEMSPQAAEGLDPRQLAAVVAQWRRAAHGEAAATAQWLICSDALGVVLLDLGRLTAANGIVPAATWQTTDLEQAYSLLGRLLRERQAVGLAATPDPAPAPSDGPDQLAALTRRQRDIVREVALGNTNIEIARALHISVETVKSHIRQILLKLKARNRTELAALYREASTVRRTSRAAAAINERLPS